MSEHVLKVAPEYFEALADGTKTFEVRKNDRGFQKGDTLILWEYVASKRCERFPCSAHNPKSVRRKVTFVYSGDPRFGGIEPGYVVLGLKP